MYNGRDNDSRTPERATGRRNGPENGRFQGKRITKIIVAAACLALVKLKPDDPDNPNKPDNPDDSGKSDANGTNGTTDATGAAGTTGTTGTPGATGAAGTSDTTGASGTSDAAAAAGLPDTGDGLPIAPFAMAALLLLAASFLACVTRRGKRAR